MTAEIELAKQHGIQYRLTPEGTTEMWCHERNVQAFAEAVRAAERERIRVLVEAVRDANATSQDEDDCLIYTPAVQRSWEALLRGLEGPNVPMSGPHRR